MNIQDQSYNCKNLLTHMNSITKETKTGGVNNG